MKYEKNNTEKLKITLVTLLFFYLIFSFYEWSFYPGVWDAFSRVAVICLTAFVSIGESHNPDLS